MAERTPMVDVETPSPEEDRNAAPPASWRFRTLAVLIVVATGILAIVGIGFLAFGGGAPGRALETPAASPQGGHENHNPSAPITVQSGHDGHGQAPLQKAKYHCPMHPSYTSDKPGNCPICGMKLVPMKESLPGKAKVVGRAPITASDVKLELSGVRFGMVEKRPFAKTIRAAGRVEYNERLLSTLNVKFAGWVEKLFVSAVGDFVEKGAPLFEIYSPDLLEAQRSYVLAVQGAEEARKAQLTGGSTFAEQNLASARERLILWDLTEEQLRALEEKKEPLTRVTIRSKASGVVTRRNVTAGNYVTPGTEIFALADLSSVWVRAEIYEYEIPFVKTGLTAKLTFPGFIGEPIEGEVAHLYPSLNEQARTLEIRIEAPNPAHVLKPGMFVSAAIEVALGAKLVIDEEAVLASGLRNLVFVEQHPNHLTPREVVLGAREGGWVAVERGLSEGERIVTAGTFLVDSESRLRAALQDSPEEGHAGHRH
jgi:RND family efflux transporter MFP subunit